MIRKTDVRTGVSVGIIALLASVYLAQMYVFGRADTIVALFIVISGFTSLIWLFGKGTVRGAVDLFQKVQNGSNHGSDE